MSSRIDRRRGFSLIELVVVLLILGIIAGFATQQLRGVSARKRLVDAVDRIRAFDTAFRREASVRRKPVAAQIDQASAVFRIESEPAQEFALPNRVTIQSLVIAQPSGGTRSLLVAESDGVSPSYAIKLRCDESTRWVAIAGGSGQLKVLADEKVVSMLFAEF